MPRSCWDHHSAKKMPKQCTIHVAIVWYHFGLAQCLKSSDICEKPTYKHINIIIIIIGILGRIDYRIILRPYPPRICTSPYLQFQQSMTNSSHRSPGGGEGRMTGWRRELNPQPADRRKRDQLPRSLGHSGPQTYKHAYIHDPSPFSINCWDSGFAPSALSLRLNNI